MDINSLPPVSSHQIEAMNRKAEKMAAEQGMIAPHPEIQRSLSHNQQESAQQSTNQQEAWQLSAPVELTYGATPEEQQAQQKIQQPEEEHIHEESEQEDIHDHEEATQAPVKTAPSIAKRKTPAESFSELKSKAERLERENLDMMRKLYEREMSNAVAKSQQMKIDQEPEEDLDFKVADDDLVDGKVANKIKKTFKQQQQELREQRQRLETLMVEQRLKAQYPDFDNVVSKENLDMLAYMKPSYARALNAEQDLGAKAEMAYDMIKDLGIGKPVVMTPEKKRIQENANKPRLSPAVAAQQSGESPLNKANMFAEGLTPELMKQLNKELQDSRKGY